MISLVADMRRYAFVAIERDEAILWNEGLDSVSGPIHVKAPVEVDHRHMRTGQYQHGHDTKHRFPEYFEEIASHLKERATTGFISSTISTRSIRILRRRWLTISLSTFQRSPFRNSKRTREDGSRRTTGNLALGMGESGIDASREPLVPLEP
jgi:hypothetical protein